MNEITRTNPYAMIPDGFGIMFDPARHLAFLRDPQPVPEFAPSVPNLPVYEGEGCKDRPAGYYEKGSGI